MKKEMTAMDLLSKLSVDEKAVILERLQNDSYMTLYEVAEYTTFSYSKIKDFARQKDFPCISAGRKKVVKKSELDNWLKSKFGNVV